MNKKNKMNSIWLFLVALLLAACGLQMAGIRQDVPPEPAATEIAQAIKRLQVPPKATSFKTQGLTGTLTAAGRTPGNWQYDWQLLMAGPFEPGITYEAEISSPCEDVHGGLFKWSGWTWNWDRWVKGKLRFTHSKDFNFNWLALTPFTSQKACDYKVTIKEVAAAATNRRPLRSPVGPEGTGFPGKGYYDASGFMALYNGRRHLGHDLNATTGGRTDFGAPVYSVGYGKVTSVQTGVKGWGKIVTVEIQLEGQTYTAFYGHLDKVNVAVNSVLKPTDVVGTIGDGEGLYVSHLHFEWRKGSNSSPGPGYTDSVVSVGPQGQISATPYF